MQGKLSWYGGKLSSAGWGHPAPQVANKIAHISDDHGL